MKEVSMRTLKIMDKVDYSRWEKAYEKYPKLTEIILIFDNPAGCDVAIGNKLNELLLCTEYGLNFDQIKHVANPNFSSLQMQEVRLGFEFGLDLEDIMIYAKPEFGGDQMRILNLNVAKCSRLLMAFWLIVFIRRALKFMQILNLVST